MVLLEKQATEHQVLAVGVVGHFSSYEPEVSSSQELLPVNIYHVEAYATRKLSCGQQILWPKTLLASFNPPTTAQASISPQETPSGPELQTSISDIPHSEREDRLLNYGWQVIQLGVFLMQLNDTEAEGDGERSLINWKLLMLYYRCRSRGMKYAFEAMRFITCTKALLSEKMAHRVLHGQFVNPRGGAGKNYANDLKMEHLIRDNKVILKDLGVNKTLKAVERCSKASYGMKEFSNASDKECDIPPETTKHTHACTTDDVRDMLAVIHKNAPFKHQPGRMLNSFPEITKTPLDKLNVSLLHSWLTRHKRKLFADMNCLDDDADEEDGNSSSSSEDLSDEL